MVIANLHTLDTARRYCDRVIGMCDGRIVFDGTPELTTEAARDIYGADGSFNKAATSTAIPRPSRCTSASRPQPPSCDPIPAFHRDGATPAEDACFLGASGYAAIHLAGPDAVEPVLVKTAVDGSFSYFSIGFARTDSGIRSLDDIRGRSLAFADPNPTSGYRVPLVEIPQAGYSMAEGEYFSRIGFSGGHEQSIIAVVNGDYDAGEVFADGRGDWDDGYNSARCAGPATGASWT